MNALSVSDLFLPCCVLLNDKYLSEYAAEMNDLILAYIGGTAADLDSDFYERELVFKYIILYI